MISIRYDLYFITYILEHGCNGELLELDKKEARELLRNEQAVYASPENIKIYENLVSLRVSV